MRRREVNPDAGAAHPAPDAPATPEAEFMNKAARDAKDPIVKTEKAEAKVNAAVAELLKPFADELATHATQPEILRTRGKELLQFVFAARGLTKSGIPKDIFAGRKTLAAAEEMLKNYQKALTAAKAETLNPAKDYTHDGEKMSELTKAIRGIVPKEFSSIGFWKGEPFGAHPRIPAESPHQPSTGPEPAVEPEAKKNKPPLRLEDGIEPLPDSAIGDIEEGPPPVHDEIPSLEPTTTKHIGAEKDAPPRRFDLEDLGLDEVRVMKHASTLSDKELLSDRDAVALAEAPEGFGTKHDRIVAEVKRRMEEREQQRLTRPPKHSPEQKRILEGSRSILAERRPDTSAKQGGILSGKELQDLRRAAHMDDIRERLRRLETEYTTLGITWFSRAKRERKRQLEGAIEANQALLESLQNNRGSREFERLLRTADEKNKLDIALNRELEEARRKEQENKMAIVEAPADETMEAEPDDTSQEESTQAA